MTVNSVDRFTAYRAEIEQSFSHGKHRKASYLLASLALEELQVRTGRGEEPTEAAFDNVSHRLKDAAAVNETVSPLLSLRARLLHAYMRPIVWSRILNLDGLTNQEARSASQNMELEAAHDEAAAISSDALHLYDEATQIPLAAETEAQKDYRGQVVGYLNESTPPLLAGRHNTAKQLALPSLAYDDQVSQDLLGHIDGYLYDNRRRDVIKRQYPFQVKSRMNCIANSPIPIISQRDLGNVSHSTYWPVGHDKPFMTVRKLLLERKGKVKDQASRSTLDRISSTVFNKIKQT